MAEPVIDEKILWVEPAEILKFSQPIEFAQKLEYRKQRVVDGDWDQLYSGPNNSVLLFLSSWPRYLAGHPLETTEFGKYFFATAPARYIKNWENLKKGWMTMYEDIRDNGFCPRPLPDDPIDEYITIDIGRNGELYFHNGMHRLVFCMLCGTKQVPVKVMIRHRKWQDLRDKIEAYQRVPGRDGNIYSAIDHVDLAEYKSWWGTRRLDVIKSTIATDSKTVLDVGAHWGQLSFGLQKAGKQCTAVESCAEFIEFFHRFKAMHKSDVRLIAEDFFSFIKRENTFDTILFLNILHHFAKTKEGYQAMCAALSTLKTKEVFFMGEDPKAGQMSSAYWNPTQGEFALFIATRLHLTTIASLFEQNGRRLYRITR